MKTDMIDRMMRAVTWMEDHLRDEDASLVDGAAAAACLSEYHFQRLFKAVTGLSPALYVRRRRLTLAADLLLSGDEVVIQIALGAGYDSQEAFTRAFKSFFGVSPARLRRNERLGGRVPSMASQPVLTRDILVHFTSGGITPEPEFRTLPSFRVAGCGGICEINEAEAIDTLWSEFWDKLRANGKSAETTYGICRGEMVGTVPERQMQYMAAFELGDGEPPPEGMDVVTLPAAEYAVFTHRGRIAALDTTVRHIWQYWLPRSGRELMDAPDFEKYGPDFDHSLLEGAVEIWVPLKPQSAF